MSPVLTREYAERTSESKTSLVYKNYSVKNGKKDSEDYQSNFSVRAIISVFGFGRNLVVVLVYFCAIFRFLIRALPPFIILVCLYRGGSWDGAVVRW